MFSLYRTLSLRYLRQHWVRASLAIASIALGVATLVATGALDESMEAAGKNATTPLAGLADFHVGNGDAGVRRELADRLAKVPGIATVEPLIVGRVRLPELDRGGRHAMLWGVVWKADKAGSNPWQLRLDWSVAPDSVPFLNQADPQQVLWVLRNLGIRPVLVGHELAADLARVHPHEPVQFQVQSVGQKPHKLTRAAVVRGEGTAAEVVKNVLVMDLQDAADLLRRPPGVVSRLDLFLEPGADRQQVQRAVEAVLDGQAKVQTTEAHGQSMREVMTGMQIGFKLCGMGALVVGLFLIYNALAVSVAERRHEIGILRSLGATRGQVAGLFAGEAVMLGIAGTVLGIVLGRMLAYLALGPVSQVMSEILTPLDSREVKLTWFTQLGAALAGVATALLASLIPAMQAASDEPADVVRRVPPASGLPLRLLQVAASILLIVAGTGGIFLRGHLYARLGTYGGLVLVFLGLLLLTPRISALLARLLQPLARRHLAIGVRLATDNLVRSPGRTGLVIASLAAGVALVVQTAGVCHSNEGPILEWLDQSVTADLFVSLGDPITAGGQNLQLEEALGQQMQKEVPGVASAIPVRFRRPNYGKSIVVVVAFDTDAYYRVNRHRTQIPGLELFPRLRNEPGSVLISENFAALYGKKVGDRITLDGPRGPIDLNVIGTIVDYSWNRGTVIMDREFYRGRDQFDDDLVDVFDVYFHPNADPERTRQAVIDWGSKQALFVMTQGQLREFVTSVIRRLFAIAYLQEFMVAVVAALGVVMSLLISVLQRQRELGLLRAVGATQEQVLVSVLAEATLMGLIGTLIGAMCGLPLEWYVVRVIIFEETGFLFPVRIPWQQTAVIAGLSVLIATLAGLLPALHALRLRIAEAIAYE